jgi:hypothetical protein
MTDDERVTEVVVDVRRPDPIQSDLEDRVRAAVLERASEIVSQLGIPAHAAVRVQTATVAGPLRVTVRVNGARCRFPDRTIAHAVLALDDSLPESAVVGRDSDLPPVGDDRLPELVALTCAEAIRLRPSALMTGPVLAELGRLARAARPDLTKADVDPGRLREVIRPVLDLGIGIAPIEVLADLIATHANEPTDRVSEEVIARLSPGRLEVLVPEAVLDELEADESVGPGIKTMSAAIYEQIGLVPPRIAFAAASLPPGTFALRVNRLAGLPSRLVPADRCFVDATSEALRSWGIDGEPVLHPARDMEAALCDKADLPRLSELGLPTFDRTSFVLYCAAICAFNNAGCFVTRDSLVAQLSALARYGPYTVSAARAQLPDHELTGLIRRLALDRVPLGDLVPALERVVDLPALNARTNVDLVLTDPAVPVTAAEQADGPDVRSDIAGERAEDFLRSGLRHQIGDRFSTGPLTMRYLEVDHDVDLLLDDGDRSEAQEDAVIDAVAAELRRLPPSEPLPAIITAASRRRTLRDLVQPTFPLLAVLAPEDLPSTLSYELVGRIGG